MRAVMLSVRPQWCELIANGQKTVEVRKSRPKIPTPFKCYIYCTQGDMLASVNGIVQHINQVDIDLTKPYIVRPLNGKVIGEFVCDAYIGWDVNPLDGLYMIFPNELQRACLTGKDFEQYGNGKTLYGWHISALQIYDRPKELSEFHFPPERYCEKELCGKCPKDQVADVNGEHEFDCEWERPLTRPPQSWCYIG